MAVPTKASPMRSMILTLALLSPALGNVYYHGDNAEPWVHNVRKLVELGEFMQACKDVFVGDSSLSNNSYLMSDYAREIGELCARYPMDGGCPSGGFGSLPTFLQDLFFEPVVGRLMQGNGRPFPTQLLARLGDTGYIVSEESLPEIDSIRNDFCVKLQGSFGVPVQDDSIPEDDSDVALSPTDAPAGEDRGTPDSSGTVDLTDSPTAEPTDSPTAEPSLGVPPVEVEPDFGQDLGGVEEEGEKETDQGDGNEYGQNASKEPPTPTYQNSDDELSVGAIIGIAFGTVVILLIIFYCEARRRNLSRQVGIMAASLERNGGKSASGANNVEKGTVPLSSASKRKSSKSSKPSKPRSSPIDEVKEAINKADWDGVYRLASQLAEEDDLSLSSGEIAVEATNRGHLSYEDQERTRALDELMAKGDWTGLAVTAALYAGESGHNRQSSPYCQDSNAERSLVVAGSSFKDRMSNAVADGDWKQVQLMSQEIEQNRVSLQMSEPTGYQQSSAHDIEEGRANMEHLVGELSAALNAGDWAQVNYYANRIKEEKGQSDTGSFASNDLPGSASQISLTRSHDSSDTDLSKKQTIEKLVKAQKWKGVSIMANLYEMESKQNAPVVVKNPDSRPSSLKSSKSKAKSASSRRSSSRKSSNTKELQYSDRIEDNIVGFRE